MTRSAGFNVKKPVSVWNREVKVNFKDLFKALGKAVVNAKVGKFDMAINSLVDSVAAFELKKDAGQLAWLLIYRSISRAMLMLVEDNLLLIREATRGFRSLAGELDFNEENLKEIAARLDYSVDARDLAIERSFFERPRDFPIVEDIKKPFVQLLESFAVNPAQAEAIGGRFPSYFVFALNEEWRERRDDYKLVAEELPTPFTKAAEIEQAWSRYYAWGQKRIDEPLFQEAFSLRQIYIPLRAYFENETEKRERMSEENRFLQHKDVEKIVVDLENELESWISSSDAGDAIRILSGGPGYGKSSVSKIFAARQSEKNDRKVLFVPLHLFEPSSDLNDSLKRFIEMEGFFPAVDFLHPVDGEKRLLLVFDGLDELSMQGKVGGEVAAQFVKEVQRKVDNYNRREPRLKVLICGRDISVQAGAVNLDRRTKILHLLPYHLNEKERAGYTDEKNLLQTDQRNQWWANYGKVSGKNYDKLPPELDRDNLAEITALPLLNYLVALSYTRGRIDFTRENNLNAIYQDLLESVYERENVWADKQHPILEGVTKNDFFRIFEEVALAAWHSGETRTVSNKEIEKHCENSGLKLLLEKFREKAKDGIASLLVAFYFRKSGARDADLNETFEFTHKSFGEYLAARRIVRGVQRIRDEIKRRQEFYESGWDEIAALTHWIKLCGQMPLDEYILNFIRGEVALYPKEIVAEWQTFLSRLFSHVLKHGSPMEKLADERPIFKEEIRQAKNSEETLLAALNACALVTEQNSNIEFTNHFVFNEWLESLDTEVSREILTYISFEQINLVEANFMRANLGRSDFRKTYLGGANFEDAYLEAADFEAANLSMANLSGTVLMNANLLEANLTAAILTDAHLNYANLKEANLGVATLRNTILRQANLEESILVSANCMKARLNMANLERANLSNAVFFGAHLEGANLSLTVAEKVMFVEAILINANLEGAILVDAVFNRANLSRANLLSANIDGASFKDAILDGATWIDGRIIVGGEYPNLIFADDETE